jgi:hypothetical protein
MLPLEVRALLHGPGQPDPLEAYLSGSPIDGSIDPPPAQLYPLSSVPELSSHPSSKVKVFLDFNGAPATRWGPFNVPDTPAYDLDGDPTTFSDTEIDGIKEVFSRVSEKYSPFNVNVTTVDPGTYPYLEVVRVVIGGDGAWAGGVYGGYGYVNGLYGSTSNTAWIFPKNLGKGRPKYVAEASAHEAGHNFGLSHQSVYNGTFKVDEYNHGTAQTAPIMGFSYFAERGLWWNGPSSESPFQNQSDVDVISRLPGGGFGYRPDDHGNSNALADWLTVSPTETDVSGYGVIETIQDADYFKFFSPGGYVQMWADVAPLGPMLDLSLRLTDADGNMLALADTASLGEYVAALVPEGDYYLVVTSHGSYGDIGQYFISGTTVPEPGVAVAAFYGIAWLMHRRTKARANKFAHVTLILE